MRGGGSGCQGSPALPPPGFTEDIRLFSFPRSCEMGCVPAGRSGPKRGRARSLRLGPGLLPRPKPLQSRCHHQRPGRPGAMGPRLSGDMGVQPIQYAPRLRPVFPVPLGKVPQLSVPQFPPGTLGSQYLWCEVVGGILGVDT